MQSEDGLNFSEVASRYERSLSKLSSNGLRVDTFSSDASKISRRKRNWRESPPSSGINFFFRDEKAYEQRLLEQLEFLKGEVETMKTTMQANEIYLENKTRENAALKQHMEDLQAELKLRQETRNNSCCEKCIAW